MTTNANSNNSNSSNSSSSSSSSSSTTTTTITTATESTIGDESATATAAELMTSFVNQVKITIAIIFCCI